MICSGDESTFVLALLHVSLFTIKLLIMLCLYLLLWIFMVIFVRIPVKVLFIV